jgi:hypothetical protein
MSFTVESKSQLAKLMAKENITVQHQKLPTAMFDTKSRTLHCPIWNEMSSDLYDLLLGHEISHALHTPEEGWHNAVTDKSKGRYYKGFLNVIEDIRIEKKVKRLYPGLRRSFIAGYKDLLERDFFEIKTKDINTFPFIDRLNIYEKCGVGLGIKFSEEEQFFVNKAEAVETWEDVVRVAEEIYEYCKKEMEEKQQQIQQQFKYSKQIDDEEDDDERKNLESDNFEYDFEESEDLEEFSEDEVEDEEKSFSKESSKVDDQENEEIEEELDPISYTDEAFRKNETKLLSEDSKEYLYLTLPTPNLKRIVTPAKKVQQLLGEHYARNVEQKPEKYAEIVRAFKRKNEKYVSLLAKEFEMRKAAKSYSKIKLADTGDIDTTKLYKYQIESNIFRKLARTEKGKNHGMILLIDKSGSMAKNMAGTIEQTLILAMFCRKVNIPFVVYGFGNNEENYGESEHYQEKFFNYKEKDLALGDIFLREYMSSNMSNADFNNALKNMIYMKNAYEQKDWYDVPNSERLSSTPLIEALIAMKPIAENFKLAHKVDIMNMIVLHDGDADSRTGYYSAERFANSIYESKFNVVLRDEKYKLDIQVNSKNSSEWFQELLPKAITKWFSHTTGIRLVGFFIVEGGLAAKKRAVSCKYYDEKGNRTYDYRQLESLAEKMKKDHFVESFNDGYKKFFFVSGGKDLDVEDDDYEVAGKFSTKKLTTAFLKHNKKRQISRILVNKFIQEIS